MRFYKNIFIIFFAITIVCLPVNLTWKSENILVLLKSQTTSQLGVKRNTSIDNEQEPKQNFLLKSNNTFSTLIFENNNYSTNLLFHQNSPKSNFHTLGITLKKKSAKYFATLAYISHFKFIYTILKNSNLIYPFHFFK